ncbi:hAT family dimerization protein [Rhizoctonia solani 123E]|uniref:HAT family dimerization protein n=1 Tax=Rhizoctonia solani 123E TaxID=1423351 RepID=A0A074RYS4_9AGAM|nr:hAT family dimerization protein [Rhizoctonia solani 123E]
MLQYLEVRERRSIAINPDDLSTQASQAQGRGLSSLFAQPVGCLFDDEFGVTPLQSPAAPIRVQPTPQRPLFSAIASIDMKDKFSLIHAVAMDVLPAQASSVSSEQVFSSSKLTCTRARNRMKANTVELLQILKYALRNRYRSVGKPVATVNMEVHIDTESQNELESQSDEMIDSSPLDLMIRLADVDWGHDAILDEDLDSRS